MVREAKAENGAIVKLQPIEVPCVLESQYPKLDIPVHS